MTYVNIARPRRGRFRRVGQFATRAEAGALLRLAAPLTGLALVNMLMSVTDTVMTAAFGLEALAAVAVGSDFYSIFFYLAIGCIGGLAPLYAAAHARGDRTHLARLRAAGAVVCMLLALPTAAALWHAPIVLRGFGVDPSLVDISTGYVRAMALTLFPMLAVGVLRTRLTAIERPGIMLRITLCAVPLNAVFNFVLMYGVWGLPAFGVTGAGISSCLVGCLTLAALIVETRRAGDHGLQSLRSRDVAEIFRIGLPIGIATLAEVGIYLSATFYAATLSVTDAAAHAVAIRLAGITYAFYFGLQQAAMTRMARSEHAPDRQRMVTDTAMLLGVAVGVALCLALVAIAAPLAEFMLGASAPAAVSVAIGVIAALAVAELVGPAGASAAGLLRGQKVTRPVMVYSLIGNWLVSVPLALVMTMVLDLGAFGIWIAMATGTVVYSGLSIAALWQRVGRGTTRSRT